MTIIHSAASVILALSCSVIGIFGTESRSRSDIHNDVIRILSPNDEPTYVCIRTTCKDCGDVVNSDHRHRNRDKNYFPGLPDFRHNNPPIRIDPDPLIHFPLHDDLIDLNKTIPSPR